METTTNDASGANFKLDMPVHDGCLERPAALDVERKEDYYGCLERPAALDIERKEDYNSCLERPAALDIERKEDYNGCLQRPAALDVERKEDYNGCLQRPAALDVERKEDFDYSKRSQWLRAAVLGANDGLVSTASMMMGIGAVKQDMKTMILTGFAGLVAGTCSMAIGEFVSVYSQYDIEVAQMKRNGEGGGEADRTRKEKLPNPFQAAAASALAFASGALVPLLAASFVTNYRVRLGVVIGASTLALVVFGWLSATLGKAPVFRSAARVLIGGWLAMAVTFGLTKLMASHSL